VVEQVVDIILQLLEPVVVLVPEGGEHLLEQLQVLIQQDLVP
tara:strand:+ start:16 stop:141 length:126 start_codon:yes stop_codon:yes gene_type:complete